MFAADPAASTGAPSLQEADIAQFPGSGSVTFNGLRTKGIRFVGAPAHSDVPPPDGGGGARRGSHALHDGFEVIRWRTAGLSTGEVSILWSISVAAEVLVFIGIGPWLLDRLGPGKAAVLSAIAGVVRWGVAARTAWFPAMAMVEPLHGLTFALLHLACMDMIGRVVPARLAATAQAFYATIAMGATASLVTLATGSLYGGLGASA